MSSNKRKRRGILVAGVGYVDPKTCALTGREVRVTRAYGRFSVGTVIPNMPAAEREARIRQNQVAPWRPKRRAPPQAAPDADAPASPETLI